MEKIKILHIIKSLGRGGAEVLLVEALKLHNQKRYEFHYIYFLPWKNQLVKPLQDGGGTVVNIPAGKNTAILFSVKKIAVYIKEQNISLVHCHLPWAGFAGRLLYKRIKIPVIYSEHNKQERYHFATRLLNKISFNRQSYAIAVSNDVAVSVKKNIRPHIPVKVILNGVDTNTFTRDHVEGGKLRKQYNIAGDTIVLGIIAVFRFQKRLKEWVNIFEQLLKSHRGLKAFIIGDGPLKNELLSYIESCGLQNDIILPGLQTEVKPWLSAIDIFFMTSEFEGLPVALLEAMSMECAVVSTGAGGISEVIRNNEDGFTVPVNEWREIIKPLSRLIENPGEIKIWGAKARARVQKSFSLAQMVEETENLYDELVSK